MGAIDSTGRTVIGFEWSTCTPFDRNDCTIVSRSPMGFDGAAETRTWGVINRDGNQILPTRFHRIQRMNDSYFAWRPSGLVEYDTNGDAVANVDFVPLGSIVPDAEGFIAGRKGKDTGWFDGDGNFRIKLPEGLRPVHGFDNSGLAIVSNADGLRGAIDPAGKLVIQPEWEMIFAKTIDKSATLFDVERLGKKGVLRRDGQTLLACEFETLHIDGTHEIIIAEKPEGHFGLLDLTGQIVVPFEWDLISVFNTAGMGYAEKGNRRCWLNRQGDVVLELPPEIIVSDKQFDSAGFLSARRGELHGCINRLGNVVVDFQYDRAFSFDERDQAIVSQGGLYGLIDRQEKKILPFQFQNLSSLLPWSEWLLFEMNDKYGFIDRTGNNPIKTQFENQPEIDEATIFIETNMGFGILETDGRDCVSWSKHPLSKLQSETEYADSTLSALVHLVKTLQEKHSSFPHSEVFYSTYDEDSRLHGLFQRGVGILAEPRYQSIHLTDFGIRANGKRVGSLTSFADWLRDKVPGLHGFLQTQFPWYFRYLADEQLIEVLYDKQGVVFWQSDDHFRDHMRGLAMAAVSIVCLWRARRTAKQARPHATTSS